MSYSEFPHSHMLEYDEHQILFLVQKLESEYAAILSKTEKAASDASLAINKVDSYMTTIDARINQQVSSSTEQTTRQLKNDFQNINNKFNNLQNDFNALSTDVGRSLDELRSELELFKTSIREEISVKLDTTINKVDEKVKTLDALTAARMRELSEQIVIAMNMVEDNARVYTDVKSSKLFEFVENMVHDYLDDIMAVITEIKNSQIYNNVGWLWNNLCSIGGFTAGEIYEYGDFNVDMWNESGITCEQWFTSGKQILGYNTGRMFDKLSGRFVEVGHVVAELIDILNAQGIIKNGFDALSINKERGDEYVGSYNA